MLCLIQVPESSAQLSINNNSTFGDDSNGFILDFYDDINNVENFVILGTEKISHPIYYNATGGFLGLILDSYDPKTNQEFSLTTGNTSTTYGYDYETNGNIRISKGELYLEGYDHSATQLKRKFTLNLVYDGSINLITMKPDEKGKFGLEENTILDWKDKILDAIKMDLEIIIPLQKKDINLTTGEINGRKVIIDSKSPNYGKPILTETKANIQIKKANYNGELTNFIIFDPGLKSITNYELRITDDKTIDNDLENSKKTPFGFGTTGFRLPDKGDYKGLSTEDNIEEALVGIINFVLGFVASIAVLVLIYGGYLWIVDRGEGQLAEKSRKLIANAVIGILLIISAWTIINTVTSISDVYPEGCEVGFDMGGGETDFDIDCNISSGNSLLGGGIQGAVDLIF